MIRTPKQALEFVRKHGIVTMTASAKPSLVEAIVGGPVKGAWWGHAKGRLIFRLAESLHDSRNVMALKLVEGKVTFLHRTLWPALARVVTDPEWRRSGARALAPDVGRLFRTVETRGSLRLNEDSMPGRKELEQSLLVHSGSVHTEKGSHATVLTSWKEKFDSATLARARRLSLDESRRLLGL